MAIRIHVVETEIRNKRVELDVRHCESWSGPLRILEAEVAELARFVRQRLISKTVV